MESGYSATTLECNDHGRPPGTKGGGGTGSAGNGDGEGDDGGGGKYGNSGGKTLDDDAVSTSGISNFPASVSFTNVIVCAGSGTTLNSALLLS